MSLLFKFQHDYIANEHNETIKKAFNSMIKGFVISMNIMVELP